jgi:exodeoxyribonuclease VII large subunit
MAGKSNFFDFRESLLRNPEPQAAQTATGRPTITVSQLTGDIDRALKAGLPASVAVRGELSNYNAHRGSGHHYFTMKDAGACVDCVMFKSDAARLRFLPTDGMEIVATGRVAVYAQRGRYQLYVSAIQPLGQGALELAFQQLRAKLEAEGLFAAERKRELPGYPLRIVIVTSTSTAALADMLKVLRRFPFLRLSVYHVAVQGDGCGAKIADAIDHVSATAAQTGAEVMVVGRGGGSLEDLWGFNEEVVARAIARSTIPVITGIGHEVDVSIADLVADYHAHTPTEAAQVLTRHWRSAVDAVAVAGVRLGRAIRATVDDATARLEVIARHPFFRRPTDRLNQMRQRLDDTDRQLQIAVERRLHGSRNRLASAAAKLERRSPAHAIHLRRQQLVHLDSRLVREMKTCIRRHRDNVNALDAQLVALSPEAVLKRGYTITTRAKDGAIVRSAGQLRVGDKILTRFADGEAKSVVEDGKQMGLFE